MSLTQPNQPQAFGTQTGASQKMPPDLVEAVKANLEQELNPTTIITGSN